MTDQNIFYQTDSRIALLEKSVGFHEKEIMEIKENHKILASKMFGRLDELKNNIHNIAISSKDIVIHQQKESNKTKNGMLLLLLGFIAQTATGILLIFITLNQGG